MAIQTGSDDSASETEPDREDPHQAIPVTQEAEAKDSLERMIQHLPSKDLASLINSLQAITTDVNLSSSLGSQNFLKPLPLTNIFLRAIDSAYDGNNGCNSRCGLYHCPRR